MKFQICPRQACLASSRDRQQRPHQPVLKDPDAAQAAFIEVLPFRHQIGLFREMELSLKGAQNGQERLPVLSLLGSVAPEVYIEAAAAQLTAQVAERQQL